MSFWQKIAPEKAIKLINFWPPYLGAGIKVLSINDERTKICVQMKQTFLNTNYVGVHFGGSLYSMCDPFYMLLLSFHLGKEHIIWDKSAEIEFLRPGKGIVKAEFEITMEEIERINKQASEEKRIHPEFETYIYDKDGVKVARVKKTLYVRQKNKG
ncbi:putative thioesterase [Bacteriovorax sp. BAL6_X]|uniref:DUF4442 domain-containing protein n=1 Tax=Bacteriovorax sp. BAL6_X TaxID=1201290 RepID=UPI00038663A9|nr:DUF4442 domain-containing protein [Bacteriovorax sp. BAL6_X]EPZ49941.1 putative thioesterase [Bacteriovorax sp. BAL6_X]